jgi:rare lipoprotein A (peptidoglycan hydrolase)
LSSRTKQRRLLPITASVLGGAVVFAVAVAGFTGWPPARALAATVQGHDAGAVMLGVDESTAVSIGPEVPISAKFETSTATATVTTGARLLAPASKRTAKVEKKAGSPKANKAPSADRNSAAKKKAKKAPAAEKAKKSAKKASTRKWRKARVSWYGPGFYGHGMAGGGKLKRNSMVVAHRSLPFGTKVKIKYKGRTVTAVVKDRGPFIKGRVFDLGPGTAKALHFSGVGTIKYKIIK